MGYFSRQGPETRGSVLWVYWGGRNRATDESYDVGFPLIWSFRSPKSSTTAWLFPLGWSFRRGDTWFNAGAPIWWSAGNDQKGWRFRLVVPFLFWKESEHGAKFSWISPIFLVSAA